MCCISGSWSTTRSKVAWEVTQLGSSGGHISLRNPPTLHLLETMLALNKFGASAGAKEERTAALRGLRAFDWNAA